MGGFDSAYPFTTKGYGRIYVARPEHVGFVRDAVRATDEYELPYMPDDFVAVFEGKVELVYGHKFEADIHTLTLYCLKHGVWVWCITQRSERFEVNDGFEHLLAGDGEKKEA